MLLLIRTAFENESRLLPPKKKHLHAVTHHDECNSNCYDMYVEWEKALSSFLGTNILA